jgi:hypothetical protein
MFCRNCGAQIDSAGPFCGACGAKGTVASLTPPKPTGRKAWPVLAGALVIFFLVWAIVNLPANRSSTAGTSVTETPAKITHKMNETVNVGVWSYEVTGVRWANSIGSDFARERPDAKFLLVDVVVRNNDRTASTLGPLKLVDAEQREYDESSKGVFMEGSFEMLKSVNPGVTSSGTLVFDVPPGSYWLLVPGGFGSGEATTIDLE